MRIDGGMLGLKTDVGTDIVTGGQRNKQGRVGGTPPS